MRAATLVAGIALAAVCASGPALAAEEMVIVPIEQAAFVPVNPSLPDGPQIAVLWGDPATGPSAMLLKLNKGAVPLHTHSSDYHLVVLRGTMKHWSGDQTEEQATPLEPGSYWFQPGHGVHADSCLTEECLMQIVWSGKRDGQLAAPAKP